VRQHRFARLLPIRKGHFQLESGHHGDTWVDLELLFVLPEAVRPFVRDLASRLRAHRVEAVCGPLVEGAFAAMMVAAKLGVPFTYAEREADESVMRLSPFRYRIPGAQREVVRAKRIAVVTDVIHGGFAVRSTLDDLAECGATPVVISTLAVLGERAAQLAQSAGLPLEMITALPNEIWEAESCPLCKTGVPLNS
jgi:orotate phosphoribosyltransferase